MHRIHVLCWLVTAEDGESTAARFSEVTKPSFPRAITLALWHYLHVVGRNSGNQDAR
jgi:hypothetical protein